MALPGSLMLFVVMMAVMATVDLALTGVVAVIVSLVLAATCWIQLSTAQRYIQVRQKMAELTGERQLLCATRALVAAPEILILDEATSSVDPQTEREVQAALMQLLEGRTSLTVAHRLTTILGADNILVLGGGQLIEQGSHRQLLEAGGFYSRLFELQFAGNGT